MIATHLLILSISYVRAPRNLVRSRLTKKNASCIHPLDRRFFSPSSWHCILYGAAYLSGWLFSPRLSVGSSTVLYIFESIRRLRCSLGEQMGSHQRDQYGKFRSAFPFVTPCSVGPVYRLSGLSCIPNPSPFWTLYLLRGVSRPSTHQGTLIPRCDIGPVVSHLFWRGLVQKRLVSLLC